VTATVRKLFDTIGRLRANGRDDVLDMSIGSWSLDDWRKVFLDLPLDSDALVAQFETSWDASIATLEQWCHRFRNHNGVRQNERLFGFVGVLILTMISLRHSELRRSAWRGTERQSHTVLDHDNCAHTCQRLIHDSAVRDAFRELYSPPSDAPGDVTIDEWESIDFDTVEFHRHGTTSFILKGRIGQRLHGEVKTFALKCIIYPFLRIPRIARATRDYAMIYNPGDRRLEHLIRVWASSECWILMDFVHGETFGERLDAEIGRLVSAPFDTMVLPHSSASATSRLRIDLIEKFGKELFLALADLEKFGIQHCDLTPANIIVTTTEDGRQSLRLIDLGVNYLYMHNMLGLDGTDAAYVAPEIRAIGRRTDPMRLGSTPETGTEGPPKSDLYSLGQLLVQLGCGRPDPRGMVPDVFYAEAPAVARFIEDLLDRNPERRLLIFGSKCGDSGSLYTRLWGHLCEEIEAVKAARLEKIAAHGTHYWWSEFADLRQPLAGALSRRLRLWQVRRKQDIYRDPDRNMRVRWLLFWSTLSALTWTATSTLVTMWTLRNTGWDWDNQVIVFLQKVFDASPDEFPLLDQLRATDYQIPSGATTLALGLLGLSFTLIGVKYYQSLFADITPMVIGWRSGYLTRYALGMEIGMRIWTFVPFFMILTPILVQPQWWLLSSALGMTLVTLSNWLASSFGRVVLAAAREAGLSTVPQQVSGLSSYSSWIPGNVFYAAFLWIVAILLYFELAQDVMVYIVVVGAVNVVQLYGVKCSIQGSDVRAALGRTCIAAERLKYVLKSSVDPDSGSPVTVGDSCSNSPSLTQGVPS
jgi:serine/threonine protein kinase